MSKKIFIDPGHGGTETGCISVNGVPEKSINLPVALKLRDKLKSLGFDTMMSRESDIQVSLDQRAKMANDWGADIFISVHHNANQGNSTGFELIHSIYHGTGQDLANDIASEYILIGQKSDCLGVWDRQGEHGDYYAVIRETNMPAIISEYCYLDNPTDFAKINDLNEQDLEAEAITRGVCKLFGINPVMSKDEIVQYLIDNHDVNSPDYWRIKLQSGQLIDGGFALVLLQRLIKK